MQLRVPGPTPCPEEVLNAMTRQMVNHRGKEFGELLERATEQLKRVFQTKNDMLILTGSGTGGLEAAVVNTLSPGDRVLAVSIGAFGDRFGDIAAAFGAQVTRLGFEWGTAADPEALRRALKADPSISAVLVTHNETSTGVTNDLASIAAVVRESGPLLLVDGVSSVGSINLPVDEWGCDVVATGSQKGWMAPPGLAMVSVSQKAWAAFDKAKMPRFYWDFGKARRFLNEKKQNPWTPAVSVLYGLAVGLDMMEKETLQGVFARHAGVSQVARDGVKSLGLSLFADEAHASNTVTAVKIPEGVNGKKLLQVLREEHGVVLAGGQQKLDGKIFRIGHLGWVEEEDMREVLRALEAALPRARG